VNVSHMAAEVADDPTLDLGPPRQEFNKPRTRATRRASSAPAGELPSLPAGAWTTAEDAQRLVPELEAVGWRPLAVIATLAAGRRIYCLRVRRPDGSIVTLASTRDAGLPDRPLVAVASDPEPEPVPPSAAVLELLERRRQATKGRMGELMPPAPPKTEPPRPPRAPRQPRAQRPKVEAPKIRARRERRERLLALLAEDPGLDAVTISERLDASPITIAHDLTTLAGERAVVGWWAAASVRHRGAPPRLWRAASEQERLDPQFQAVAPLGYDRRAPARSAELRASVLRGLREAGAPVDTATLAALIGHSRSSLPAVLRRLERDGEVRSMPGDRAIRAPGPYPRLWMTAASTVTKETP